MIALRWSRHHPPPKARTGERPVYAVGDVHGCYDLLRVLLAEIARDAAARDPTGRPQLILCGDYIDRGPESAKVLTALTWLERSDAVDVRLLKGNHEAILRDFLQEPEAHAPWLDFGGRQTLASYGVDVPARVEDRAALRNLRDTLLDAMPAAHFELLGRLETLVEIGDYIFVHAGIKPRVALARQKEDDLLWIREEFLDHPRPIRGVVVHGHTWFDDQPTLLPHRVNLDTGAYETGVLTAVRIADDELEVIQAVRDRTAEAQSPGDAPLVLSVPADAGAGV